MYILSSDHRSKRNKNINNFNDERSDRNCWYRMSLFFNTLIQNLPDIRINTNKLDRRDSIALRGLKTLPMKFTPVA